MGSYSRVEANISPNQMSDKEVKKAIAKIRKSEPFVQWLVRKLKEVK